MPTAPAFRIKLLLAAALVVVGDFLLFEREPGLNLVLFAVAWLAAVMAANPAVRHGRLELAALGLAGLLAAIQVDRPSLVGWLLFGAALGVAVLAPRAPVGEDAWRWVQRFVVSGLKAVARPVLDLRKLRRVRARRSPVKTTAVLAAAVLPLGGGLVFLWLFSLANPLISDAISRLRLSEPDVGRIVFWLVVAAAVWTTLRPPGWVRKERLPRLSRPAGQDVGLPIATPASVALSLAIFNALFALQNGLDLAFLWSGAPLPDGVTFADYAHRGAYPLVATALLAGVFVLVFLRPGSPTAQSDPVRWLVVAWILQNVFLVASTALRTLDYVDAYALTRLRVAALLWMGLVALGLVLILWRLLRSRSGSWLINANALAVGVVLVACSVVDLGAVAAAWNVRHAREAGGRGVELDLCYLGTLRGAALVSLAELEQRPLAPDFRDRVAWKRRELRGQMYIAQDDPLSWRWRDARRLARDANLPGAAPLEAAQRDCDGRLIQAPRPAVPLTPGTKP